MALRLEVLDEDEQHEVWDCLIKAVEAIDVFSAKELHRRIGKPYAFSVNRRPHHPSAHDVVQVTRLEIWVGEDYDVESDDFRFIRALAPVLSLAAVPAGIDEIVVIDWAQRLNLVVAGDDTSWGWYHSPDHPDFLKTITELKKQWAFRRVPDTPTVELDGFEFTPIESHFYKALKDTGLTFTPQCWLVAEGRPKYRVDFMVYYGGRAVAVEIDGHESHKKKEDRNRDSERDRFLLQRGMQTIRFTGSQVHKNVGECIEELGMCLTGEKARPSLT